MKKFSSVSNSPAIGIRVTVSCVLALSSMMTCEKCLELNALLSVARVRHPAVVSVQTNTRNPYKNANDGNRNSPFTQLQIGLIFLLTLRTSNDFPYIRNISPSRKTSIRRAVISSHAEFELAHTSTDFVVERTISSIAAQSVRVLPVPRMNDERKNKNKNETNRNVNIMLKYLPAGPNKRYGNG